MQNSGDQTRVCVNQKVIQNQTGTLGYVNSQPRGAMVV